MKSIKKAVKKRELVSILKQMTEDNFKLLAENRELSKKLVLCRFDVINANKSLQIAENALVNKEIQLQTVAQHTAEILRCTHEFTKD